jgi:AraC-like DNA-binding protein
VLEFFIFTFIILLVALVGIYLFFYISSYRWSARGIFITGFLITTISLLLCALFASLYYYHVTYVWFLKTYFIKAYAIGVLVSVMIYFWLKLKYKDLKLRSKKEEIQRFLEEAENEKLVKDENVLSPDLDKIAKMNEIHQVILYNLQHLFEIEKVYLQQELSIDDVAKMLQTNSKYLSNAINQNYQKSFTEYVNTWRVEKAMAMLKEQKESGKYDHLTIQTIAEEAGFKSRTSFYTAFNRMVGVTPVEYQKTIRG